MPEQIYITDIRLDPDRMIFEGVVTDGEDDPHFTVSDCAGFFFGRSPHWIRWLEQEHKLVLDGDPKCPHYEDVSVVVPIKRTAKAPVKKTDSKRSTAKTAAKAKKDKTRNSWMVEGFCSKCKGRLVGTRKTTKGMRNYTLGDIEEVAHALAQNSAINGEQLSNALVALQIEGKIWGLI